VVEVSRQFDLYNGDNSLGSSFQHLLAAGGSDLIHFGPKGTSERTLQTWYGQ
jgi:hypothetical protein